MASYSGMILYPAALVPAPATVTAMPVDVATAIPATIGYSIATGRGLQRGEQETSENVKSPFVMIVLEVAGAAYAPVIARIPATSARRSYLLDLTSNVCAAGLVRAPTTCCLTPPEI